MTAGARGGGLDSTSVEAQDTAGSELEVLPHCIRQTMV